MANVHFCPVFNLSGNVIKYGETVSMISASCHRRFYVINPLMDCWGRAHPRGLKLCDISFETIRHILKKISMFQDFLFGLQNIVNSKNSVHDGIKHFIGKKCDKILFFSSRGLNFVKFVKQITLLNRARYSAHFDTKLRSIVFFLVPKRLRFSKPFL
ncbi:hypothetical protein T07_5383 [Trichinella nelsoni]|uniref:Uncharacterized protein n=1 Tax=Trichinella nelsoni TaxID=6336 RepID=A0A0V0RFN9_9BILA|nr:hypothetical protein T07_5383 [Trichinella nelsoni]